MADNLVSATRHAESYGANRREQFSIPLEGTVFVCAELCEQSPEIVRSRLHLPDDRAVLASSIGARADGQQGQPSLDTVSLELQLSDASARVVWDDVADSCGDPGAVNGLRFLVVRSPSAECSCTTGLSVLQAMHTAQRTLPYVS